MDAKRTAARLALLGHQSLIDPVIEIEPMQPTKPVGEFAALVFTSANAVRLTAQSDVLKAYALLPVFSVGTHTAEVARECGYRDVAAAAGDVNALHTLLAAELPASSRVLHPSGEDRAGDLPALLTHANVSVETIVIYRARARASLNDATIESVRGRKIDAVLHYSPRSAAIFVQLAEAAGIGADFRQMRHLCLSPAVAEPLKAFGISAEIAAAPEEAALFELVGP